MPPSPTNSKNSGCEHGGRRPGCGRKPGVKTQAIRLPEWLLEQLNQQGDARKMIIEACIDHYQLHESQSCSKRSPNSQSHDDQLADIQSHNSGASSSDD